MTDHLDTEAEDRLRETAPHDDMWGPVAWVDGKPRWIVVQQVPPGVQQRYRTGGAPTDDDREDDR
ncbi:MAG TPA: hypothetical protein VFT50_11600 [Baekduia sp.]|nr:hypothetical protein [Baekduia sp.]